jgi:hypothetical protein
MLKTIDLNQKHPISTHQASSFIFAQNAQILHNSQKTTLLETNSY